MAEIIFNLAFFIMVLAFILAMMRFFVGPTLPDRVVAFDLMTIISIAVISFWGYQNGQMIYLDVAMVYGLLSFLGVIIIAHYLEKGAIDE